VKELLPTRVTKLLRKLFYPVPSHLARNQIRIGIDDLEVIEESIEDVYERDLRSHLEKRLEGDRLRVVPWLDSARRLGNSRILEIGCGTGSSVAIAEQGATVAGIDIDEGALAVARDRCGVYGLKAEFQMMNAVDVFRVFQDCKFDFIMFFASLEHMTIRERLAALERAWKTLDAGGLLVIVETPNRLWYFDGHTSLLPFFHWLPDELAFNYSHFSQRDNPEICIGATAKTRSCIFSDKEEL
jgi:2-polyprenyl-3-methyl-5-hydroxy-6-metoxy-1,4-benzoquinol methylase